MSALDQLSAELLYSDEIVGPWTVGALARHQGVIHPDHLRLDSFYDVPGGLRLSTGRLFKFLDLNGATDLVSYVRFLLGSLAELHGDDLPEEWQEFRSESAYAPVIASVLHEDSSRLQLRRVPEGLVLDYLDPEGEAPEDRGSPYFDGLLLDLQSWKQAALEALDEYHTVLSERQASAAPDESSTAARLLLALSKLSHFSKLHS